MPEMTVNEIAALVGGAVAGDGSVAVGSARGIEDAAAGCLTFAADKKNIELLRTSAAAAAVVPENAPDDLPCALVKVKNPQVAFALAAQKLAPAIPQPAAGVHPTAFVADGAVLAEGVAVGPKAVIEAGVVIGRGAVIGAGCYIGPDAAVGAESVLYPNVTVYYGCLIGERAVIHSGAVIGADGFGFQWDGKQHLKIPQVGIVRIGNDVEIGANTTVDRARFGETVIGNGCKLDNLVHVAHNCNIGECCVFAGAVGVSGSVTMGKGVVVGGQVGFADHITVGDGCQFYAKSGVASDVPAGSIYAGQPAKDIRTALKEYHNMRSVGEMKDKLKLLEQKVEQLTNEANNAGK